jgi:Tol biopolymer transport system component
VVPFFSYPGEVELPSFAPDGEKIAFAWTGAAGQDWNIYVKVMGNDPPLRLTEGPGIDKCPAWSPDGRQVAFLREQGNTVGIYAVGALGGVERKLLDLAYGRYFDLEWSPDGRFLAFAGKTDPREPYNSPRSAAIFLLSVDTHEKRQLTFPRELARDSRFAFSPEGRTLAFLRHDEYTTALWRVPVEGGEPAKVHQEANWIGHLAWTADGQALVFSSAHEGGSKLFRIPAFGGTPEPLPLSEDFAYYPAVAPRGNRLAFVRALSDSDLWQVQLKSFRGPGKKPAPVLATARAEFAPEFSPDGSRMAFFSEGTGKRGTLDERRRWLQSHPPY